MRRWNGWGEEHVHAELGAPALAFLAEAIGEGRRPDDVTLEVMCARIEREQPSRLPPHALVERGAEHRLRSGLGQSLGDWLRLRFGVPGRLTDGVAYPESAEATRELLEWAGQVDAVVIPCGGATSVVGHLAPPEGGQRPVLTLNLSRQRALLDLDPQARLARFQAGVLGPDLEAQLRAHGCTLGHFPQSFEFASLGGWIATRSSGQQSMRYGRIEQLFAGGTLLTPRGTLEIAPFPASAAGPDLREWVLGSEGRLGVLTEAVVRVSALPEAERFVGVFLPDWDCALDAVRELAQSRVALSMLRLANPTETLTTLRLAGHAGAIAWLQRYLAWRGVKPPQQCLLFLGLTGSRTQVRAAWGEASTVLRRHGGVATGELLGRAWAAKRFAGVYLRNALWQAGYAVDTMETALPWGGTTAMVQAVEDAGRQALAAHGQRCHAYTHLSHVYPTGSSVYSTFVFRIGDDFDAAWARWRALKTAVSDAIAAQGGTLSHQHGVGRDHAPWLAREKGPVGVAALDALLRHVDPQGRLASGNLRPAPLHDKDPGVEGGLHEARP